MKKILAAAFASAAFALFSPVRAASPFDVLVTDTTSSSLDVGPAGYSSFPALLNDVLNNKNQFQPLLGTNFSANVTFLGVPNALSAQSTNNGNTVTLSIPIINFKQGFTGTNSSDVETQVKNFFLQSGSGVVGAFLKAIAQQSAVAVTDGNPNSSTAMMASSTFFSQGFTATGDLPFEGVAAASNAGSSGSSSRFSGLGIGLDSGQFKANGIKGDNSDMEIPFGYRLTDRVSLAASIPINYLDVEGAKVYGVGFNLAVPVRIEIMDHDNPLNWRLTPFAGISARGSEDLAGGGVIWSPGLTNTLDYRVNSKLILGLVDQFSFDKSIAVKYSSYKFDPDVDQEIMKNGVRAVTPLTPRLILDGFVIETDFLKAAAIKNYTTFGTSLSFHLTQKFDVTLGANYDTGPSYTDWSVGLSSAWKF
jgi:hypothetical protein